MAKVQGYFENNKIEHYEEGPWVLVKMPGGADDYRVERLNITTYCSTFPASPASNYCYNLAKQIFKLDVMRGRFARMAPVVDWLNRTPIITNPFPKEMS